MADHRCDVLVIGGGINGVGIARDLAGRGWSVLLCEQDDLGSHTSSASTKLIHGGLRYLEYGKFSLVRKALAERELLLRCAPHIMGPMRFVLPHDAAMRPAWMIRMGLWLYDHLAPREFLPGSKTIALHGNPLGAPLQPQWAKAFVYSDGWVDDARLVVLCALDAANRGAVVLTRTRCAQVRADGRGWEAQLARLDPATQAVTQTLTVKARMVVNAGGPWAEQVLRQVMGVPVKSTQAKAAGDAGAHLRLVKGSHIVVPRRFTHDHAYLFQGQDGRVIFAIPYERDFTLIGTTDVDYRGAPGAVQIDRDEVNYLCDQASRYLRQPVFPSDVVWSFAGVRPLLDDAHGRAAAVTRDYRLEAHTEPSPWLTVWGGKLTTFRLLAEQAADLVSKQLGDPRHPWTAEASLPGGQLTDLIDESVHPEQDMAEFQRRLRKRHPWLDLGLMRRWSRAYGSLVLRLLDGVSGRSDLGAEVAPDLYEVELYYLKRHEWALTADDVLWRRSKLGLHYTPEQCEAVARWWQDQAGGARTLGFHHSDMSRT
ncbi:MAG: glycerol-3-phosphate dehydrogenase [Burkholderiales bacterium]|nr:glycerol-3-phosphate dehydrogenase [Burkholderiales bacterium]